ncbi:hypothetical protein Tco_0544976 [Tanacetum coccineum]
MKRDYNLWKSLKNGETGLGWNASAQKLDCADEWWKMKIKEDPNFKKLQKKQPSLELQYAWDQLFGDVVAGGEDCISSAMNTKAFQEVHNENAEDEDVESDDDLDDTQEGKYYLVDKGYPERNGYLVPYSKTRYHQSQNGGKYKILGGMFSVKTQIAVIMAAFALHNYIRNSDEEDMMFTTIEQHLNYIPPDELHDVRGHETNTENVSQGTSNEMKRIRDDIATSIWNARRQ